MKVIEENDVFKITEDGYTLTIESKATGRKTYDRWKVFPDGWTNKRLILNKLKAIVLNGLL